MWTDSKISLSMGLQSTLATKRKHEFTSSNKTNDFHINCSPSKSTKWSIDRNNLLTNGNQIVSHNNSIAKIDIVSTVPSENWNQEPVDCISKLQAVTVPSDTWGSISTRSTLATTLLSTEDIDEDDDDFEDDYDDEESVIPTYCSVRYACPPQPPPPPRIYQSHSNGYITKPNFYTEPFPQQNCSRTINQHFRVNGLNWNDNNNNSNKNNNNNSNNKNNNSKNNNNNNNQNQNCNYYISSETLYPQQTIRCAENGKSYLELGSSNLNSNLTAKDTKKCGCDGRGTWCNSKNCYKDIRLKIRNLSMFKLSKFRQVSEQSLYRSVLICNTLKQIDKEIEIESKDAQQQLQQHIPIINSANNNNDYSPIRCTRVCNLTRGNNINNIGIQQRNHLSSNNDGSSNRECFQSFLQLNNSSKTNSDNFNSNQQCTNDLLHPYDHYPFREPQSGRATPFPAVTTNSLNETDSGFGDDDNNRSINWSSVLSLSSQSALDPLNNNDLFSILPSTTLTSSSCLPQSITSTVLNGIFTSNSTTSSSSTTCSSVFTSQLATTTSTITDNNCTSWEYGFFDMDLGLGTEFTELVPGCKISSEEIFKTITPTLSSSRYVHENEMESPAHIMVGS